MGKNNSNINPNTNPYRSRTNPNPSESQTPSGDFIDFNTQRICPSCGRFVKKEHNFCKYCGVDLSDIPPIGDDDEVSKQLAITSLSDPDPEVRKEAVDTLGNFKDIKVLGVLTYILLHDQSDIVRREAADEIGDLHHPYSLEALTKALKDPSPLVRKEAIEGLKKIKEKTKEKDHKKGKPEEREIEKEDEQKEKETKQENEISEKPKD
jgi:hypothetical protein